MDIIESFKRNGFDDDDAPAMAAIYSAMSGEHPRTIAQLAIATGYAPSFVRQTLRYLLSTGDIQADDDAPGWLLT